jgi:hypothetical protein
MYSDGQLNKKSFKKVLKKSIKVVGSTYNNSVNS